MLKKKTNNMFEFIIRFIKNTMRKKDLEKEKENAIAVAQRLGNENKILSEENHILKKELEKLKNEFDEAVSKVRQLSEQMRMKDLQNQSKTTYSDSSRNY